MTKSNSVIIHLNGKNIFHYYNSRKKMSRVNLFVLDLITKQITSLGVNDTALYTMKTNAVTLAMHQYSNLG